MIENIDIQLTRTEPIPENWLEIAQQQKAAYANKIKPSPIPIEDTEEPTEAEKIEALKNAKKYEINRLNNELNANSIETQISDKLDGLTTLTQVNDFNVLEEITASINTLEYQKKKRIEKLKEKTSAEIYALYPAFKQNNMALGIYSEDERQTMVDFIMAKKTKCDEIEAKILASKTIQELNEISSL